MRYLESCRVQLGARVYPKYSYITGYVAPDNIVITGGGAEPKLFSLGSGRNCIQYSSLEGGGGRKERPGKDGGKQKRVGEKGEGGEREFKREGREKEGETEEREGRREG